MVLGANPLADLRNTRRIEMVIQQGVAYTSYVHYHSLWRDKTADYGGNF